MLATAAQPSLLLVTWFACLGAPGPLATFRPRGLLVLGLGELLLIDGQMVMQSSAVSLMAVSRSSGSIAAKSLLLELIES